MSEILQSALLCPIRPTKDGLETLLTRRNFWNYNSNRPMRFPGEWTFAGGKYEDKDREMANTAIREFREELNYAGPINYAVFLRTGKQDAYGVTFQVNFFSAKIDDNYQFRLTEKGEVIEARWMNPAEALSLIKSDEFAKKQLKGFVQTGLNHPGYGMDAAARRQIPAQTIKTLEFIESTPHLREAYG